MYRYIIDLRFVMMSGFVGRKRRSERTKQEALHLIGSLGGLE
jgi:hypothetical protein